MFLIAPGKTRQEQGLEQILGREGSKQNLLLLVKYSFKERKKKIFSRDMLVTWPHPAIKETGR